MLPRSKERTEGAVLQAGDTYLMDEQRKDGAGCVRRQVVVVVVVWVVVVVLGGK